MRYLAYGDSLSGCATHSPLSIPLDAVPRRWFPSLFAEDLRAKDPAAIAFADAQNQVFAEEKPPSSTGSPVAPLRAADAAATPDVQAPKPGQGASNTTVADKGASQTASTDQAASDTAVVDQRVSNTATADKSASSTSAADESASETGVAKKSASDTAAADNGVHDTAAVDTGASAIAAADKGVYDTAAVDKSASDTVAADEDTKPSAADGDAPSAMEVARESATHLAPHAQGASSGVATVDAPSAPGVSAIGDTPSAPGAAVAGDEPSRTLASAQTIASDLAPSALGSPGGAVVSGTTVSQTSVGTPTTASPDVMSPGSGKAPAPKPSVAPLFLRPPRFPARGRRQRQTHEAVMLAGFL